MNTASDVIVVGGGHAGLTAAITAAERGRRVHLLEAAPRHMRGGNSRHTRNLRPMHDSPVPPMEGIYSFDEYLADLIGVTGGKTDPALADLLLKKSASSIEWLSAHGVRFQPPLSGTLQLGRTNAFFLGGGKALVNALYHCAENLGVTIEYDARDITLRIRDGSFEELTYNDGNRLSARTLIAASGGFEANLDWLGESWGSAAANFLVRGTPYNRGTILKQLLDAGMQQVGEADQCHAVAIDGRAPRYDGGIVTRVDCLPLGIVVNRDGQRFHDEGEDFWPKRYAIWGRLVAAQEDQVAWTIIDSKADGLFMPPVFEPESAGSIRDLAAKIRINAENLQKTIDEFNAAVIPGAFDREALDDCRTGGLEPAKSHWARPIDKPPFRAYRLKPGITFTYLGIGVDEKARALRQDGQASDNILAAGEIMAGNILGEGYLAGIGMTIGSVFGRIAGENA